MPERTFGRMVRSRRTKLGLSQAKLGELVGRSPTTIRSWERDQSQPNDPEVITALAAVLGLSERSVYDKTGQEMPAVEDSPTVEQALATLAPEPTDPATPEPEADADAAQETESLDTADAAAEPDGPLVYEEGPVSSVPEEMKELENLTPPPAAPEEIPSPAYTAPPEPYYITTAVPPAHEPSYMEDRTQRQLYRVRNLATVVILVSLGIAFLWAFSQSWEALGDWWNEFFGNLRL